MTLRQTITQASALLAENAHLRDTASRDAELLLLHTLQLPRTILFTQPNLELTPIQRTDYAAALQRRLTNEPIQYITGTQEFYGLDFHVTPAVLIPRPETELLVESVLDLLPTIYPDPEPKPDLKPAQPLRIADIGTGSGIIAITLAVHLPQAHITALDLSPDALAIASRNAQTHRVADRIRFLQSDLLAAVSGETFHAILSNPPYIPTTDHLTLHPQVRDHEPHAALFAGHTGLDLYTRLIPQAFAALTPGGLLALEIGYNQSDSILQLLTQWQDLSLLQDLQGVPRTLLARKPDFSGYIETIQFVSPV